MTKTIYILRHGETTGDTEDRYGGWYENDLTEKGIKQTKEVLPKLTELGIEKILRSPLRRAGQTAAFVEGVLGLEAEVWEGWKEHNCYGILTGMTRAEAREKYPGHVDLVHDPVITIPGKQPYPLFVEQIKEALNKTTALPFSTVLVITHGGPIRTLCRDVLKVGALKEVADCAQLRLSERWSGEARSVGRDLIFLSSTNPFTASRSFPKEAGIVSHPSPGKVAEGRKGLFFPSYLLYSLAVVL